MERSSFANACLSSGDLRRKFKWSRYSKCAIGLFLCYFIPTSIQVRTDVFEFFTEVRSPGGAWRRIWPWRRNLDPSLVKTAAEASLYPRQSASAAVCNVGIVVGGYVSGILGGMAVMTLLHLNLFNVNTQARSSDLALHYYAPIALGVNRTYWSLICIAISSSISRLEGLLGCHTPHIQGL